MDVGGVGGEVGPAAGVLLEVVVEPLRPAAVQDLLAQPDESDEGDEGEGDDGAALQDVRRDVLGGEDVEGQREDGGDRAGEERPVYPARTASS